MVAWRPQEDCIYPLVSSDPVQRRSYFPLKSLGVVTSILEKVIDSMGYGPI